MIMDKRAEFSNDQAITATANSTNVYDLGLPGVTNQGIQLKRNVGKAMQIPLLIEATEVFNNLTSLAIVIQESVDAAFTSPVEVVREVVLLTDLKKGFISSFDKLPRGIDKQFIRLRYEVTGTAPSTGKISAGIVAAVDGSYVG